VSVETCDDLIAQENDHLKREVKELELEVNKFKKQAKVQPSQDNRSNVVKKLEKGKCHTPFRERGNEASIRVPRMFKSHAWQQYD
jgi:hypothetical protein